MTDQFATPQANGAASLQHSILMGLRIVKSILVDQLQVFSMVFLKSTKPVAPFVQLSPQ